MDFIQYVIENYPNVAEEYRRYTNRRNLPPIGSLVKTLRSGFGGGAGMIRRVVALDGESLGKPCIRLTDGHYDYLSEIETWYKDIEEIQK